MRTDRCDNTTEQEWDAEGCRKSPIIREFMSRGTTNAKYNV